MSSDEEDYMSEKFLSALEKQDVRPGLIKNQATIRENQMKKKQLLHKEIQKRELKKTDYKSRLEEGLNTEISESNKGFAMLQKMGYKKGESIGKASNSSIEPIAIKIKESRSGLGMESKTEQQKKKYEAYRQSLLKRKKESGENVLHDYKKRILEKHENRKVEGCLRNCQRVCMTLDQDNDIAEPTYPWFWSQVPKEEEEEEDSEEEILIEEFDSLEKFDLLRKYLRDQYFYCFWCGAKYIDNEDLTSNCPGLDEDDH